MSAPSQPVRSAVNTPVPAKYPAPKQAWFSVAMLTVVSIFAFVDRQILSLLVQPIRRDLEITDTQISLLLGAAFAFSFTIFAIPLGRLADRWSRRSTLAVGLTVWSLCTAVSGLARSFRQILLLRMGVGAGEASLNPCAYSIIADSFPEERRGTALSVYSMGIYLGSGIAFLAGGLVIKFASEQQQWVLPLAGAVRPWQLVLLEVGLAGLLCTLLLAAIREPLRGAKSKPGGVPVRQVARYIAVNRKTFTCQSLGFAMIVLASTAGTAWIPEMFRRRFDWSIPKFGAYFGFEVAIFGCLGALAAGKIADALLRKGAVDANLKMAAWIALLDIPVSALLFLAPSGEWAIFWLAPGAALTSAPYGIMAAALQQILPGAIRGQVTAAYLLVLNLVGATIGPTLTAVVTQRVFGRDNALNYALLVVHTAAFVTAAALLWAARPAFRATVDRLRSGRDN